MEVDTKPAMPAVPAVPVVLTEGVPDDVKTEEPIQVPSANTIYVSNLNSTVKIKGPLTALSMALHALMLGMLCVWLQS